MKRRLLCPLAAICLVFAGCNSTTSPSPSATKISPPARTLLVVPTDRAGAQCFLFFRSSDEGEIAITAYPRETVFLSESGDFSTLYSLFADGNASATKQTLDTLSENGLLADRILSVDVEEVGSGFYDFLASLGNNLLFTNPPSFVYTVGIGKGDASGTAISAVQLRRLLCLPAESFSHPLDYVQLRLLAAQAVFHEVALTFAEDPSSLFSALTRAGNSSLTPADRTVFLSYLSPSITVRRCLPNGSFVGEGARMCFYLRAP